MHTFVTISCITFNNDDDDVEDFEGVLEEGPEEVGDPEEDEEEDEDDEEIFEPVVMPF